MKPTGKGFLCGVSGLLYSCSLPILKKLIYQRVHKWNGIVARNFKAVVPRMEYRFLMLQGHRQCEVISQPECCARILGSDEVAWLPLKVWEANRPDIMWAGASIYCEWHRGTEFDFHRVYWVGGCLGIY